MKKLMIATTCAAALTGCEMSGETGSFSLQITDAPVTNAENVFLTISAVTVKGSGQAVTYEFTDENLEPTTKQIDLLSLTGSDAESIVEDWELPAGEYQWIRLHSVTDGDEDTYVVLNDNGNLVNEELTIPSGDLKLVSGFTLPANGTADFTIDIDLGRALVEDANGYKLKPAMRLLDNSEVGHIAGTVDGSIYAASCINQNIAIYAFSGADATVRDINGDEGPELVAWAEDSEGVFSYELGFLTAGEYTLQMVCEPVDDPEDDDTLDFIGDSVNVTVEDKQTKTHNFI